MWVETANAFDCAHGLKGELDQAKELTYRHREELRVEKAKQENLQKLIKRQKTEDNRGDGRAKAKSGTD